MALGEEKAEVEASTDTKAPSCGRWSRREPEVDTPGPVIGEQLPRLEAEGGPASPVWGAEGLPAPACCPSGACQPQASNTCGETIAGACQQAHGHLLPPSCMRTGDLPSEGSQVGAQASGAVGFPGAVLGSARQRSVTISQAFPAPVHGGALGARVRRFLFIGSPGRLGLGASRELCPPHLLSPRV